MHSRTYQVTPYPYPPHRLQSSYEDVNFEINHMRKNAWHKFSDMLMLGGDGLSYMRMIDRLSQNYKLYLEHTPVIMPRMGENPHGLFHIMHGDWRIWSPLLMRLAVVVNNKQVHADPTVAEFNQHQHFLRIVIQAAAEYVAEIAATGPGFNMCQHFLQLAEANLSFAYICFFLFSFGFKFLEYRHAVRHNASHDLDRLWRENLISARTALANKVNYRKMSIVLVYWGQCLVEPLQTFYHNTRTIRWVHSHVGWDMPIEKLNMWIKESVISNISELQICQFIKRLNFMQHVTRAFLRLVRVKRKREVLSAKEAQQDVDAIKQFFYSHAGSNFAQCTQPSDANVMSIDMTDWGGLQTPRHSAPFMQMRRAQTGYRDFVEGVITRLAVWQTWL